MKKKYLIITGGSGFIGAELVKFFLDKEFFLINNKNKVFFI